MVAVFSVVDKSIFGAILDAGIALALVGIALALVGIALALVGIALDFSAIVTLFASVGTMSTSCKSEVSEEISNETVLVVTVFNDNCSIFLSVIILI